MKKTVILLSIAFQVLTLAFLAGEREYWYRNGTLVWLRTVPIDPIDIFRGDYVRLRYDISSLPLNKVIGELKNKTGHKGVRVYTALKADPNGLAEAVSCSEEKPGGGLYIRGRTIHDWQSDQDINVKYGIEAYFVQQGKGRLLEQQRITSEGIHIPMDIQVAVGTNGTAVIKGHRWSPLGIGVKILENPDRNAQTGRKSVKLRLTLLNVSNAPLAVVILPNHQSFLLEPIRSATKTWKPVHPIIPITPVDEYVKVLNPHQEYTADLDLSEERWQVKGPNGPVEIGMLEWSERFRFVYRPPSQDDCRLIENHRLIWHGYLGSRAFHGRGNID